VFQLNNFGVNRGENLTYRHVLEYTEAISYHPLAARRDNAPKCVIESSVHSSVLRRSYRVSRQATRMKLPSRCLAACRDSRLSSHYALSL
jgi:hypothetical protein